MRIFVKFYKLRLPTKCTVTLDKIKKGRKYIRMRSKTIFVVLFMLVISIFHDSLITLLKKNTHTDIVHYMSDDAHTQECTEFNKIHSMFHFIAIVIPSKNTQIKFAKRETIPHLLINYSPPLEETSHKPPIV